MLQLELWQLGQLALQEILAQLELLAQLVCKSLELQPVLRRAVQLEEQLVLVALPQPAEQLVLPRVLVLQLEVLPELARQVLLQRERVLRHQIHRK
jgi:hypothetical protein